MKMEVINLYVWFLQAVLSVITEAVDRCADPFWTEDSGNGTES